MRALPRVAWGVVAMVLLSACADRPSPSGAPEVRVEIDTVGGVPRVLSRGTPPEWRLRLLLELGSAGMAGESRPDEFGRVSSAVLGPSERVYVADGLAREIRIFEADGSFVRSVGRPGEGPGEFGGLYSLAWVGDTLLALDPHVGRVGELSPDGEWLGQRSRPGGITGGGDFIRLYQVGPDETYAWTLLPTGRRSERAFLLHTTAGVRDTLSQVSPRSPRSNTIVCHQADGGITFFEVPFAPKLLQTPASGGRIAVAWSADYRIALLDEHRDTVRILQRERALLPVTDRAWEEETADYRRFRERGAEADCDPRSLHRPEHKPHLAGLLVDTTGRLWAEVFTAGGTAWEVFDRRGALVATVPPFPRTERAVPYVTEDRLVVTAADSLGVHHVRVYALETGG